MNWLKNIPWHFLLMPAIFLSLAPFSPQPHLLEKLGMLLQGDLSRSIDIFDLFFHSIFLILVVLKLIVTRKPSLE